MLFVSDIRNDPMTRRIIIFMVLFFVMWVCTHRIKFIGANDRGIIYRVDTWTGDIDMMVADQTRPVTFEKRPY